MKCLHCGVALPESKEFIALGNDIQGQWALHKIHCPECSNFSFRLRADKSEGHGFQNVFNSFVYPRTPNRTLPLEVPSPFLDDFREACLILENSPKASAALSRRCLQHILLEKDGLKSGDLFHQIQEVLDSGHLPSHIADDLDAVRTIGNFAAHPLKSTSSGEIFDVEPGEAEWSLDILESLFDFYFVQPAISAKRKAALNEKLKAAGKPDLK